jgi:hypothetical protein
MAEIAIDLFDFACKTASELGPKLAVLLDIRKTIPSPM